MKKAAGQVWLVRHGIKQEFAGEKHHKSNLTPGNLRHLAFPQPLETHPKVLRQCVASLQRTHVVVIEACRSHVAYFLRTSRRKLGCLRVAAESLL